MNTNQQSTEVLDSRVEQIEPDTNDSGEVQPKHSSVPLVRLSEQTKLLNKRGILRRNFPLSKELLQRSKAENSIQTEANADQTRIGEIKTEQKTVDSEICSQKLSTSTPKPSKIMTAAQSIFGQRSKTSNPDVILPARKKSKSDLELRSNKKTVQNESIKLSLTGSRKITTASGPKKWSISTAAVAPTPVKAIHKPGTLPSYLERNKAIALRTQRQHHQETVNDPKKLSASAHKQPAEKLKSSEKFGGKLMCGDAVVLKGFEKQFGNITEGQNGQLEGDSQNFLLEVEAEMKKMSDLYVNMCQKLMDTFVAMELKEENSETLETFRNFVNVSVPRLSESIAQMKSDQEATLSKCLAKIKSLMMTGFVEDSTKIDNHNALQIIKLNEQIEDLQCKVLAAEQQNKILEKTKSDIKANQEQTLKEAIAIRETEIRKWTEKCKRLEVRQKKNECKLTEMTAQINQPNMEAQRIASALEVANGQLIESKKQCKQLKDQFTEQKERYDQSIAEQEMKLSKEREEKHKAQAALSEAKEMIEISRQQPIKLSANGGGEFSCGDVSSETVPNSESYRIVINQMKAEILQLVQERHRMLSMPDNATVVRSLETNLAKSDRKVQQKNEIIYKLEHKLYEEQKRLHEIGACMQAQIVQLKCDDEKSQRELETLRAKLLQTGDELRQKDETIGMNKRLLRVRNELINLQHKDNTCDWPDQCDHEISARSEEFCNLFSKLSQKQITVTQQQLIIRRLEEHHARNACIRVKQIERFKQLETENTQLRLELMAYRETYQNHFEYAVDNVDRNQMYLNDRRLKRKSKVNLV